MGNIVNVFLKETQKNKKTLKNKKRKFSKQKVSRIFGLFFALIFILYFILIEISPQKTFASTTFYANYDSSFNATYSIGNGTGYSDGAFPELVPGYGGEGRAVKVSVGETLRYQIENNLNTQKAEIEMKFQLPYDLLGDRGKLQFYYPYGIFYDSSSDFIYVADTSNNRIVKTKIDGTGWQTLGGPSSGSGQGQFNSPYGIFYDSSSDFIYVADTNNHRIVKTKIDGTGWQTLGGPSSGSGQGKFFYPHSIFYDSSSGFIYVADRSNHRIVKTKIDGTGWQTYGTQGSGQGQFNSPSGIFYDSSSGFIYVVDTNNHRIVKTKIDGTGWQTYGTQGSGQGQFNNPYSIFYDSSSDFIYVADTNNHRIVKTKIDGTGWQTYDGVPIKNLFRTSGPFPMRLTVSALDSRFKFYLSEGGLAYVLQSEEQTMDEGSWHTIKITYDNSKGEAKMYLDGQETDSGNFGRWVVPSSYYLGDYFYIGGDPGSGNSSYAWGAAIDDLTLTWISSDSQPPTNPTSYQIWDSPQKIKQLTEDNWYNFKNPYFEWSGASDDSSGVRGYWVYFGEDQTAEPLTAGKFQNETNYTVSSLLETGKTYYLRLRTQDNDFNNSEAITIFTYKYDGVAPQNPAYIHAPSEFLGTKKITIFWPTSGAGVASDEDSGLLGYQYKINNCPWYGPNHSDPNGLLDYFPAEVGSYETQEDYDFECLEEGTNTIYLRTIDNAGNISLGTIQAVVKINTQAPSEPINLTVSPSYSKINKFSFSWEEPKIKPGGVGIKEYRYSINSLPSETNYSVATQAYLPPDSYATVRGKNVFYVVAVSESGKVNYDNYAQIIFECDSPAPGIPINVEIFDNSIRETKNYKVGLTWDPPLYLGTGFSGYKIYRSENPQANCAVDMSLFKEIATTSGTAYVDSNLESKTYYYCLKAYDNTNQMSPPSTTVSLKPTGRWKTPPNLIEEPQSFVRTKSAIITWLTDRKSNSFVQYRKPHQEYKEEVGSSEYVIYHSINLVNLDPGTTYYYRVMWTDEDGNRGVSDEYSFTTNPPPIVSQVNISDISLYSAYLSFTTKNAVQANIYYGKTTMYGGVMKILTSPEQSSYTLRFSGLEDDSVYHYMIELIDEEGNKYPFEDHLFKTLPKPRIFDVRIEQILDRPSPTLKITFKSNTDISTIVTYFPEKNPSLRREGAKLDLEKDHQIEITGLKDNTIYILQAQGFDKVGNMAVSDLQRFTTAEDTRPPKISDFFVNTKVEGQGREAQAQIIVSWKTDEPATSQVAWSSEISDIYTNYTREDPTLTYEHLVVISGLKPGSIYHLAAVSYDNARNQSFSEDWVILTPKATQSILDLTIESLRNIFGR